MNAEQRARLKQIGKDAFVREEMTRLGYWPPSPAVAAQTAEAEAALRPLYDELIHVRTDLDTLNAQIALVGDVPVLLGLRRVKGLFTFLGYNEGVATLLALLATETPRVAVTFDGKRRFVAVGSQRALPQGACTSPALTNLLCRGLDARLGGAARAWGFAYTRYADDLTFSHPSDDAPVGGLLSLVRKIIAAQNLVVNEEKTQVLRACDRQNVTGLIVNETNSRPRVSRQDLRRFRAVLHQCERDGFEAMTQRLGKDALSYAAGYLSFVHMACPDVAERFVTDHPWLRGGRTSS